MLKIREEDQAEAVLSLLTRFNTGDLVKHSKGRFGIIRDISPRGKLKLAWLCRPAGSERCEHGPKRDWWLYYCTICDADKQIEDDNEGDRNRQLVRVDDYEPQWIFPQFVTLWKRA